jgi:hypothetical protein
MPLKELINHLSRLQKTEQTISIFNIKSVGKIPMDKTKTIYYAAARNH